MQRVQFALGFAAIFGAGVATRVATGVYKAADLGLEGSLLAGILGGYVSGLIAGVLISLPAMFGGRVPDNGAVCRRRRAWRIAARPGAGLRRDMAILTFSRPQLIPHAAQEPARANAVFPPRLSVDYSVRRMPAMGRTSSVRTAGIFALYSPGEWRPSALFAVFISTVFAVTLPLKVWSATRNEEKLESQQRLLNEARLAALTRQINPHFLFNTLNSIASLIRTDPEQARAMIYRLSSILRSLLRMRENLNSLREEMQFIDDYMGIELVRFGDKLRFVKEDRPGHRR